MHVLSSCSVALDQGQLTWRHNSALRGVIDLIRPHLSAGMRLYSDLPGFLAPNGGSIPPHVLVTKLRPNIFIFNEISREAVIFELTCPWDSNVDRSHTFKEEKCAPLVAILTRTYKTSLFLVEVSVRGQVTANNKKHLKAFVYRVCDEPKIVFKSMITTVLKILLVSLFSIFTARAEPSWTDPPLLPHV